MWKYGRMVPHVRDGSLEVKLNNFLNKYIEEKDFLISTMSLIELVFQTVEDYISKRFKLLP